MALSWLVFTQSSSWGAWALAEEAAHHQAAHPQQHTERERREGGEEAGGEDKVGSAVDRAVSLMLLGAIAFVMALFSLVNQKDEDMRYYAWTVISSTVSIFMSLLIYEGCDSLVQQLLLSSPADKDELFHILLSGGELLLFYLALQVVAGSLCGVWQKEPYKTGRDAQTMEEQIYTREKNTRCWVTLLSHMTGFSCIRLGGKLQHMMEALLYPRPLVFLAVFFLFVVQLILNSIFHTIRKTLVQRWAKNDGAYELLVRGHGNIKKEMIGEDAKYGRAFAMQSMNEAVFEAENEVTGFGVSFLIIEACKLNISGLSQVTKPEQIDVISILKLLLVTLLLAIATVSAVMAYKAHPKEEEGGTHGNHSHALKRFILVVQETMGMAFAWGLYSSFKWGVTMNFPDLGGPETCPFRVLTALVVSLLVFLLVRMLDHLADMEATGDDVDLAIFTIINALGVLVGFAWEKSFHTGVEVIAEDVFESHPVIGQLLLAIGISLVVLVPWREYILTQLMVLETQRTEKYQNKRQLTLITQEHECMEDFYTEKTG